MQLELSRLKEQEIPLSVTPAQGTNGAPSTAANPYRAGGGGGATVAGGSGAPCGGGGGAGAGLPTAFGPANGVLTKSHAFRYYAGGGEGGDNWSRLVQQQVVD